MLREAIELIQKTTVEAQAAEDLDLPVRHRTLVNAGGVVTAIAHDPPARQHEVCDLASLGLLLGGGPDDAGAPHATVWHQGDTVIAVLDDRPESFRDDRAVWRLKPSRKFHCLLKEAPQPRDQKSFVHFIVQNLRDELEAAHQGLLGILRNMKFSTSDDQTGSVQHGRESMGRDIHAAIAGADKLPETVVFQVRRWANLSHIVRVECLLIVNVAERKISLVPLADELEAAEDQAQAWLHATIDAEVDAPVFYGTP